MRILVIRRDNIGDLVCTTPLIAALRRRYPEAHLAALVNSYNAAVVAGNPDLDAVYSYTKLKHRQPGQGRLRILADRLRLLARLRRERIDHVVLAKSEFDRHGLALARSLRARSVLGFLPKPDARVRGLSMPLPPPRNHELHEVEVMMQLAAALDARAPAGPVQVFANAERVAHWRERLSELGDRRRPWVAVHLSARDPTRAWPADKFVSLIRRLDCGVVLIWAPGHADDPRHPGDDEKAAAVATQASPRPGLVPVRTASVEDLTAVLSLCDGFIGVDGGAMHLAAGLGLPIVALFENLPHSKRHWRPWGPSHEVVSPESGPISGISVDQVLEAWQRLPARAAPS